MGGRIDVAPEGDETESGRFDMSSGPGEAYSASESGGRDGAYANSTAIFCATSDLEVRGWNRVAQNLTLHPASALVVEKGRLVGKTDNVRSFLSRISNFVNHNGVRLVFSPGELISGDDNIWSVSANLMTCEPSKELCMYMIMRPTDQRLPMSIEEAAALLGLTTSEAKLALHIAAGIPFKKLAPRFEVRESTLRTQLRSIYEKLNVHNQCEMVAKVWKIAVA